MKNVFTSVTVKTLKKNRTRTLVTVIGILLAASMLTAVTTFISSLRQYMIDVSIENQGNWYGAAFGLPAEKIEELKADERTDGLALWQELGYAKIPGITEGQIESFHTPYFYVAALADGFTDMMPIEIEEGRMPENSGEIAISKSAMDWGLTDVEIGGTLELELGERKLDGETLGPYNPLIYRQKEGTSGIELAEELVSEETRSCTVVGVISSPAFLQSASHPAVFCLTRMEENPAADASYTCFYRTRRVSDAYPYADERLAGYEQISNSELMRFLGNSQNRPYMRMLYGLGAILILLIMTGGISLVYSSFAISVSDRTRQFGLLASVGATPRQLRGMVLREALILGGVGIPLGIGAGILGIGVTLAFTGRYFAYLVASDSTVVMGLHVAWPAVFTAALAAFATVLISAWIPARRAAKIPPVEAIRQSKDVRRRKKEEAGVSPARIRGGRLSYRFFGLPALVAGRHFSRDKRQYRTTIFSLFVSIVLFISASSFSMYLRESMFGVTQLADYDISVYLEEGDSEAGDRKAGDLEAGNTEAGEPGAGFSGDSRLIGLSGAIRRIEGVEEALKTSWVYAECLADPAGLTEEIRAGNPEGEGGEDGWVKLPVSVNLLLLEDADYEAWLAEQGVRETDAEGTDGIPGAVAYQKVQFVYNGEEERYVSYDILSHENTQVELILTDSEGLSAAVAAAEEAGGTEEEVPKEEYQQRLHLQVTAFVDEGPMNIFAGYSGLYLVMPESRFRELAGERADLYLTQHTLYLKAEDHRKTAERIQTLVSGWMETDGGYAFVNDEAEQVETEKNLLLTVDVFTYGFIVLISLIAAANVFNTISTAFLLRRREFAVLSSVGMTPKEMSRMLNFECLFYGLKALLFGIPAALLVTYEIYRVVSASWATGFRIPAASIPVAVVSVFAVVFAAMLYARSKMRRENIIDSIREESL